jgi:hypothetical protein
MFGRPTRLRLLLWIASKRGEVFYQGQAVEGTDAAPSAISKELGQLEALQMLQRVAPDGSRRVYYEVLDSSLWALADTALVAVPSPLVAITMGSPDAARLPFDLEVDSTSSEGTGSGVLP